MPLPGRRAERGQATVETVLLSCVLVVVLLSVFSAVRERLVGGGACTETPRPLACQLAAIIRGTDTGGPGVCAAPFRCHFIR